MAFMEKNQRNLAKHYPDEELKHHGVHHNRKPFNSGQRKDERFAYVSCIAARGMCVVLLLPAISKKLTAFLYGWLPLSNAHGIIVNNIYKNLSGKNDEREVKKRKNQELLPPS